MAYRTLIFIIVVLLLPILLVVGVLVWIFSGSPIVFRQERVGKGGKRFIMYKFRTMRNLKSGQKINGLQNESDGPVFKMRNDPRFTGIGKILSHTGLDELPQLWNVLKGEMALLGPRPLPVAEAKKLSSWMQVRHHVLPGIISPAILSGRYHENFKEWMKSDVTYAKNKNFWKDMAMIGTIVHFLVGLLIKEVTRALRAHD